MSTSNKPSSNEPSAMYMWSLFKQKMWVRLWPSMVEAKDGELDLFYLCVLKHNGVWELMELMYGYSCFLSEEMGVNYVNEQNILTNRVSKFYASGE